VGFLGARNVHEKGRKGDFSEAAGLKKEISLRRKRIFKKRKTNRRIDFLLQNSLYASECPPSNRQKSFLLR